MAQAAQDKQDTRGRGRFAVWLAAVFALAFIVRLAHVLLTRDEFAPGLLLGDGRIYEDWATRLATGTWAGGDEVLPLPPLYAWFLAVLQFLFVGNLTAARVAQALLGAAACIVVAGAGRRLFSPAAGIVAGFAMALYAPAILYDGLVLNTSLAAMMTALLLWQFSRVNERCQRGRCWLGLGLTLGCLVLCDESALLLAPALLIWMLLRMPHQEGGRVVAGAAFLLGVAVIITPVGARNRFVAGAWAISAAQLGPSLYLGLGPDADGARGALRAGGDLPQLVRHDARLLAEQAAGTPLSPAGVSWHWTKRAIVEGAQHPGRTIGLLWRKLITAWRGDELVDAADLEVLDDESLVLRLAGLLAHFGVLAPLAVAGLVITWPRRRQDPGHPGHPGHPGVRGLHLLIGFELAALLLFTTMGPDRHVLAVMLMLPAGAGLALVPQMLARRRFGPLLAALVVVVPVAIAGNRPELLPGMARHERAVRGGRDAKVGASLLAIGAIDTSVARLRSAVELVPDRAEYRAYLGLALHYQGRLDEARAELDRAVEIEPDSALAHSQLGRHLSEVQSYDEAIVEYRRAVEIDPHDEAIRVSLGDALRATGRPDEAAAEYREAVRLNAKFAQARALLGAALVESGQVEEGLSHLEEAIRLDSADANARFNLGLALQRQGRLVEARAHLEEALGMDPEHIDALLVLGVIDGTQGRHADAAQRFEALLQIRPDHDEGQFNLGVALNMLGRPKEALGRLRESLRLKPDMPQRMTYLAGLLATNADASVRDPEEAIRIAEKAAELTARQDATALDTLGAAYAAAGRFEEAIATAGEALGLAQRSGAEAYAQDIAARIELYRQGRPYVAPGR